MEKTMKNSFSARHHSSGFSSPCETCSCYRKSETGIFEKWAFEGRGAKWPITRALSCKVLYSHQILRLSFLWKKFRSLKCLNHTRVHVYRVFEWKIVFHIRFFICRSSKWNTSYEILYLDQFLCQLFLWIEYRILKSNIHIKFCLLFL